MPLQTFKEIDYESQVFQPTEKDPLFVEEHNIALSRNNFISKLKALLSYFGFVHCDYSGHSFRIGAATTCASNGIQDYMIQTLGRWESNNFMRYIRTSDRDINSAQKMMYHCLCDRFALCTLLYIFSQVFLLYFKVTRPVKLI
jgi:site-specific recombinase XerD